MYSCKKGLYKLLECSIVLHYIQYRNTRNNYELNCVLGYIYVEV